MYRITDITGVIDNGMWNLKAPFPDINITPFPPISWMDGKSFGLERFEGMHSQTGTYLETPAHYYGNENSYLLIDVPVQKLIDIPCVVLNPGTWEPTGLGKRQPITLAQLQKCANAASIRPGDAVLIGTGWGKYWMQPQTMPEAPYFTYEAMHWLIEKKPFLLGCDVPQWDSMEDPQNFFAEFYKANILMGGPFVSLQTIGSGRCLLTILPIKVCRTSCAPARAVIKEENGGETNE